MAGGPDNFTPFTPDEILSFNGVDSFMPGDEIFFPVQMWYAGENLTMGSISASTTGTYLPGLGIGEARVSFYNIFGQPQFRNIYSVAFDSKLVMGGSFDVSGTTAGTTYRRLFKIGEEWNVIRRTFEGIFESTGLSGSIGPVTGGLYRTSGNAPVDFPNTSPAFIWTGTTVELGVSASLSVSAPFSSVRTDYTLTDRVWGR
jgi:hypothetical protein